MSSAVIQLSAMASETHHEIDRALAWGIGVGTLLLLLALLGALVAFGGGREHS